MEPCEPRDRAPRSAPDLAGARTLLLAARDRLGYKEGHSTRGGKKLSTHRTSVFKGKIVDVGVETVELPNGRLLDLEIVRHPGGAAVVAVDAAGRVCLLRQYRHAAGGWLSEIPAGKLEPGEAPLSTARRELEEETGVRAERWDELGAIVMTPGFCDEVIHLFLARGLAYGSASPAENEVIEVEWAPFASVLQRALSGELRDAKTLVALFRASALLARSPD